MQSTARIVTAAQRGDREAFAELVRRYERVVVMTAWAVIRDYHAAQDVAQDCFVIAYQELSSLRHPQAFGSWLLRTTHREAVRLSRLRKPSVSPHDIAKIPADQSDQEWHVKFEAVVEKITTLPTQEREVMVFRYVDGLSVREIADATDRPLGTVTKQISRALQRLRTVFTGSES